MLQIESISEGLLENAPDAIIIVNQDGRIKKINAQAERIFGYPRRELLDQELELLLPKRFRDRHKEHRKKFFQTPHFRPMGTGLELNGLRKGGKEFPIEVSLSWHKSGEEILALCAIREITERQHMERAKTVTASAA